MNQLQKPIDRIGILISVVSLFLAIPATFFLGKFAVMGTLFGVILFFREPSLETLEVFLYGAGGLMGICGLWLRAVAQPFASKSPFIATLVAALLFVGSITALCLVMMDVRGNTHPITGNVAFSYFGKGLLGLAVIAMAIALYNILPNLAVERDAAKARRPSP